MATPISLIGKYIREPKSGTHISVSKCPQQHYSQKPKSYHVTMAHTCNPNYSGRRNQEDDSSKPALANSS
jgi:hypothetical protein